MAFLTVPSSAAELRGRQGSDRSLSMRTFISCTNIAPATSVVSPAAALAMWLKTPFMVTVIYRGGRQQRAASTGDGSSASRARWN